MYIVNFFKAIGVVVWENVFSLNDKVEEVRNLDRFDINIVLNITSEELEKNPKYREICDKRSELEEDNLINVKLSEEVPTLEVLKEKGKDVLYNQIACQLWKNEEVLKEIEKIIDVYVNSELFVLLEVLPFLGCKGITEITKYADKVLDKLLDFAIEGYYNEFIPIEGKTTYYSYGELYIENKLNTLCLYLEGQRIFDRNKVIKKIEKEILNCYPLGRSQFEKIFYFLDICSCRRRGVPSVGSFDTYINATFCDIRGLLAFDDIDFFPYDFITEEYYHYLSGAFDSSSSCGKDDARSVNLLIDILNSGTKNIGLLYETLIMYASDHDVDGVLNVGNRIIGKEMQDMNPQKLLLGKKKLLVGVYSKFVSELRYAEFYA